MFRKMRRFKQQLTNEDAMKILRSEHLGVLSLLGDDDYPYGLPIDYICDDDGHLYFHCAKAGHKIDAMTRHDKVSFCVIDKGWQEEGDFARFVNSVIVFGRLRKVEDHEKTLRQAYKLALNVYPDQTDFYKDEIRKNENTVQVLELIPEHITGKRVHEQ